MSDKIFGEGIFFNRPNPKAPTFVKGTVSLKMDQLAPFMVKHVNESGYVNLVLKESKGGKLYFELGSWTKTIKDETKPPKKEPMIEYPKQDINPDDIPF